MYGMEAGLKEMSLGARCRAYNCPSLTIIHGPLQVAKDRFGQLIVAEAVHIGLGDINHTSMAR